MNITAARKPLESCIGSPRVILARYTVLALALNPVVTSAQSVDTSEWLCEFCPFESGSYGDYTAGVTAVSDDSAYFGDGTGYDEEGAYAAISGHGGYAADGYRLSWTVRDLGLASRSVAVDGGHAGTWGYRLSYRELPHRQFNTTSSVFANSGSILSLPASWIRAPATSGLTNLGSNLTRRNIESDRTIYEIGASYLPSTSWSISADFRRQEQEGTKILGGSYYTNAALLPVDIAYATDEVDLGLQYASDNLTVALGGYLSEFDSGNTSFGWQHPFSTADGAEFATLAAPPDNRFQQMTISAGYALTALDTYVSFSGAIGNIKQTEPFLSYTSNAGLAVSELPRHNLEGDIDTARVLFSLTARPVRKARVRFSYRYDERDNKTTQALWNRVLADSFVSGDLETNIPYSYERRTLSTTATYQLLDSLQLLAGYERIDKDYDFQEVAQQQEDTISGRLRWRPITTLEVGIRGGAAKRDIDRYNELFAETFGQNPLLRKYNLAYRYREFGELWASYSPTRLPLSITFNAMLADDRYTKSQLGLTSGEEVRVSADLYWPLSENTTIFLNAGTEDISSQRRGGASGAPFWNAGYDDNFVTVGAGLVVRRIAEKFDLLFDYTRSDGSSEITIDSPTAGLDAFPDLASEHESVQLRLSYLQSERMNLNFNVLYQRFRSDDWALEGVSPATIPVVLSLGAQPYSPEVYIVGIGFRYRLGKL